MIAELLARWGSYIEDYSRLKSGAQDGPDVAQDARRRIAEKLLAHSSFDVAFNAVVTRCVRDAIVEHYRWRERHGTSVIGEQELARHSDPSPDPAERDPDPRADRRVLSRALQELGEPDAQIVWMKIIEELPTREIAQRVGLTGGAVDTRFSRAQPQLARLILQAVRNPASATDDEP